MPLASEAPCPFGVCASPCGCAEAARWVEAATHQPVSAFGARVAALLDRFYRGLHHLPPTWRLHADFGYPHRVSLVESAALSTFDFDGLTRLVFLAHDFMVRVEVEGAASGYLRLHFCERLGRTGPIYHRHPDLAEAVAAWRSNYPLAPAPVPATGGAPQDD